MSTPTDTFGCVGNTIKLRSGRYFDFANPRPEQFTIGDIASGLAKCCRFGGQAPRFYSVAEHSMLCCALAKQEGRTIGELRAVLMHDAAEAFTGDIVKPLKIMLLDFGAIEARVEEAIAYKWGLDFTSPVIKSIDRSMLIFERNQLWPEGDGVEWEGERETIVPPFRSLQCMDYRAAEVAFTRMANELGIN